jgi:hypothetical protein
METVELEEAEECPFCHKGFRTDNIAVVVHSYYYKVDVYLHKDCWTEYVEKGGCTLDFIEPANKLPI